MTLSWAHPLLPQLQQWWKASGAPWTGIPWGAVAELVKLAGLSGCLLAGTSPQPESPIVVQGMVDQVVDNWGSRPSLVSIRHQVLLQLVDVPLLDLAIIGVGVNNLDDSGWEPRWTAGVVSGIHWVPWKEPSWFFLYLGGPSLVEDRSRCS